MSVLAAEDIDVSIGGTRLLREVSCSARVGRLTGLIGPNAIGNASFRQKFTQAYCTQRCLFSGFEDNTISGC